MNIFKDIAFRSLDISSLKAALDYNEIRIKNIEKTASNKTDLDENPQYKLALKLSKRLHDQLEKIMLRLEKRL